MITSQATVDDASETRLRATRCGRHCPAILSDRHRAGRAYREVAQSGLLECQIASEVGLSAPMGRNSSVAMKLVFSPYCREACARAAAKFWFQPLLTMNSRCAPVAGPRSVT